MPVFLLTNWRWLLPTAASVLLAVYVGVQKIEIASLKADAATAAANLTKERADAVAAAADFAKKSAAKDAANAELSRDLESARAKAIADAAASADDFAKRLRAATTAARNRCVSAAAAPAGEHADAAAGGDDRRGSTAAGVRIRDVIKTLQADVQLCWAWGAKVGR